MPSNLPPALVCSHKSPFYIHDIFVVIVLLVLGGCFAVNGLFWDSLSLARNIHVTGVRSGGLLIGPTAKNKGCSTLRIHQQPTVQKEAGRPHKLLPISDWWVTVERPVTALAAPPSPCLIALTFFLPSFLQCPLSLEHQGPPPDHHSQALRLAEGMICLKVGEWNSGQHHLWGHWVKTSRDWLRGLLSLYI